jgi:hypothetical protein
VPPATDVFFPVLTFNIVMSYIILRGHWCNIIVLNVHAPTEDKIDDINDRFYDELEQVFDNSQGTI